MEVVEFEENHAFGALIRDGDTETLGRMVCEPLGADRTRIVISVDMPSLTDTTASERPKTMGKGTEDNIKALIEAGT